MFSLKKIHAKKKKRFPGGPDPCRGVLGPRDWALDFSAVNDDNGKTM